MNPRLEWTVPLVVGLVSGVGLYALAAGSDGGTDDAEHDVDGDSSPTTAEPPQPIVLPFRDSWGNPDAATTHVVLAPLGKAAAMARLNESLQRPDGARPDAWGGTLEWQGDRLALFTNPNIYPGCREEPAGSGVQVCHDETGSFGGWSLPRTHALADGDLQPRLLQAGHNATRATAFVFDEVGLLVASNAPSNETARFTKHPDYLRLPSSAWYLGANATAPNGTARLPSFAQPLVDRVMGQLDGLPVGGVASTRSNAYVALYGSLFVTIRVDELVYAP